MPLPLAAGASTLLIRKDAFERAGITRDQIDHALQLTDEEFRVERGLVAIGPVYDADGLQALVDVLEERGLTYFNDFCEMSGNWPGWLSVFALVSAH